MPSIAGLAILAEYYTLLLIALFLIFIRAYVRVRITKGNFQSWGWDDSTIIIAWVCPLASLALHFETQSLIERRVPDIPPHRRNPCPNRGESRARKTCQSLGG